MLQILVPHLRVESVLELDVERLREMGLDALLLDVDCTLKSYRSESPSAEISTWLRGLQTAGIGLCLVSNGLGRRIERLAARLDVPFVAKAAKPFPFGIRAALRKTGFDPQRTAMVGDQLFADVIAASGPRKSPGSRGSSGPWSDSCCGGWMGEWRVVSGEWRVESGEW